MCEKQKAAGNRFIRHSILPTGELKIKLVQAKTTLEQFELYRQLGEQSGDERKDQRDFRDKGAEGQEKDIKDDCKQDIIVCAHWLEEANRALENIPIWRLPVTRGSFARDTAYACLHKIRHRFCGFLPIDQLVMVLDEIRQDFDYLRDEAERREACITAKELLKYVGEDRSGKTESELKTEDADFRYKLGRLSGLVAHHRQMVWHKVNLMHSRLMVTLLVLIALLVTSIWLMPSVLGKGCDPAIGVSWYDIVMLQVAGALGGALSALMTRAPLDLHISQYYPKQAVLLLRPAVGAAAGLALGLVQLSGIISVFPEAAGGSDVKWEVILLVAFVGGFSERLFLGRLDDLVGEKSVDAGSPAVPDPATDAPETEKAAGEQKDKK